MKTKLLSVLVLVLLIALPAFGASREEWELANLLAQPEGRSVVSGDSVILELYYSDASNIEANYAQVGISETTTTLDLNLYEVGALGTTTRFGGSDSSIDLLSTSYDTLGELISAINNDTSEYWNATLGKDGHEEMSPKWIFPKYVKGDTDEGSGTIANANVASSTPLEYVLSVEEARALSAGVKADTDARVRLKYVEESTRGERVPHWIEVVSGDEVIYRKTISVENSCSETDATDPDVSPNTIELADGHQGLGGFKGKNLCVLTRWPVKTTIDDFDPDSPVTGNLSIIYDIVKP